MNLQTQKTYFQIITLMFVWIKKDCKHLIQFNYPTFIIIPSKLIKNVISNYTNNLKSQKDNVLNLTEINVSLYNNE